jgi:hypothetical protein
MKNTAAGALVKAVTVLLSNPEYIKLTTEETELAWKSITSGPIENSDFLALVGLSYHLCGLSKHAPEKENLFESRLRGTVESQPHFSLPREQHRFAHQAVECVVARATRLLNRDYTQVDGAGLARISQMCSSNKFESKGLVEFYNAVAALYPQVRAAEGNTLGWQCSGCKRWNFSFNAHCKCGATIPRDPQLVPRSVVEPDRIKLEPRHTIQILFDMARLKNWSAPPAFLDYCASEVKGCNFSERPVAEAHKALFAFVRLRYRDPAVVDLLLRRIEPDLGSLSPTQLVNVLYSTHFTGHKPKPFMTKILSELSKDIAFLSSKELAHLCVAIAKVSMTELGFPANDNLWHRIRERIVNDAMQLFPKDVHEVFFSLAKAQISDEDHLLAITILTFYDERRISKFAGRDVSQLFYIFDVFAVLSVSPPQARSKIQAALDRSAVLAEEGLLEDFQMREVLRRAKTFEIHSDSNDALRRIEEWAKVASA